MLLIAKIKFTRVVQSQALPPMKHSIYPPSLRLPTWFQCYHGIVPFEIYTVSSVNFPVLGTFIDFTFSFIDGNKAERRGNKTERKA
jgi:hypothetical protein